MDDDQNLDDSIDSVHLGGTLLQEQGGFSETSEGRGGESSTRVEEECESTIHFGKIRFDWTIKEFLRVWQRGHDEDRGEEGQKLLISRNFPCEAADGRVQFQLKIHLRPSDSDVTGSSFMAVYLVYCGRDEEVRANFEIAIIDREGEKKNQRNSLKVCCFNEKEHPAWGFKKFIQVDRLKDHPDEYLMADNSIVLRCTLNMVSDISSADQKRQIEIEKERLAHPWTKFQRDLDELYEHSDRYSDVTFLVEGRKFHGHRIILGAGSPLMRRIFSSAPTDADHEQQQQQQQQQQQPSSEIAYSTRDVDGEAVIVLEGMKAVVFEQVLRFIYKGTIDESLCPKDLLAAANQFQLKLLQETCEKELVEKMDKDKNDIMDILRVAEQNNAANLRKHTLERLSKTPDARLATEFPSILFELMQLRCNDLQKVKRRPSDAAEEESFPPATPQFNKRQRRQ